MHFNNKQFTSLVRRSGMRFSGLSEKTGLSKQILSAYRHGSIQPPIYRIKKLARGLGVPMRELMTEEYRKEW